MIILAWDQENDIAITPERLPNDGEWCCITDGKRITKKQYHAPVDVDYDAIELEWCEKELLKLKSSSIASYKAKLNKYKDKLDTHRPEL